MIRVLQCVVLMCALLWSGLAWAAERAAEQVNINTADVATLDRVLVNIGPVKAQAIVDYRIANGAFRSPEQLAMVKGIGLKTVEANRGRIMVRNPRDLVQPVGQWAAKTQVQQVAHR